MTPTRTICAGCSVGCGLVAYPLGRGRDERGFEVEGDARHPANRGKLCERGLALARETGLEGRLAHPMVQGRRVTWDRALSYLARRLSEIIARNGPDSIAFCVSGQMLTEDFYAANKLMKGFVGSSNIAPLSDSMERTVADHIRALGEDIVPVGYADIDRADIILLIGADPGLSHPLLLQRMRAARKEHGSKLVVIAPDLPHDCEDADLHLAVRAGSETGLMNALLAHLHRAGMIDEDYVARSLSLPEGFWTRLELDHDIWSTARTCGVAPGDVQRFFDVFSAHRRVLTVFGPGSDAPDSHSNLAGAILNVHLATGRIGRAGMGPFLLCAEPNVMGCREVGALSSALAAHMDFAPDHIASVQRFWAAPGMASRQGLTLEEMIRAAGDGRIKALWIMGAVPSSLLETRLAEASEHCSLVIVSDSMSSRLSGRAHVRLPTCAWGETSGTMTNSERLISRQRAFLPAAGEARPHWWILTQLARRLGWRDAFAYDRPADIYREHARLSAYHNGGKRLFDISRHSAISNPAYEEMTPWRWGGDLLTDDRYPTPDGRARLVDLPRATPNGPAPFVKDADSASATF